MVDYLEFDIDPDTWINRLLRQITEGVYEPSTPRRFTLAKSGGFSRTMTLPAVPDLTLYRTLADFFYRRLRRHEVKHAYFEQGAISVAKAATPQVQTVTPEAGATDEYGGVDASRFEAWLLFDEYRRQLILDRLYPFLVTFDISNFFDTILHPRLAESLQRAGGPPETVGLLFYLIERLSVRREYTDSPRIGLPVDEFDCSRKLAHIYLFPHDKRIVSTAGEDAYVRWMDDQIIGVHSRSDALKMIGTAAVSLARLYLTPNAAKSRIFTLADATRHYQLDSNAALREAEQFLASGKTRKARSRLRQALSVGHEGEGEWEKILKWAYRLAGRLNTRRLRRRAFADTLQYPRLAGRIADYIRATGSAAEFLAFADHVWSHDEQVYPDVNLAFFESYLRLEPDAVLQRELRSRAADILNGQTPIGALIASAAIAPLALLRFGDRRSLPLLRRCFEKKPDHLSPDVVRSAAVVYASYGRREFADVRRVAGRLLRHTLADLVRFVDRILEYRDVPQRFKSRMDPRIDAVTGASYFDMRSLLSLRLLALSSSAQVQKWVKQKRAALLASAISPYDKNLIARTVAV